MIIIKDNSIVKDIEGIEYRIKGEIKIKPHLYLNSRLIGFIAGIKYAVYYSNIEFKEGDTEQSIKYEKTKQ